MEEIELPYVRFSTPLRTAVEILKNSGRAALVVERTDGPALVTGRELLRMFASAGPDLIAGELPPSGIARQLKLPSNADEILYSPIARRGFEAALASGGPQYSVINISGDQARVATASDALSNMLSSPLTCRCLKDPNHVFQLRELEVIGKCNFDGADVDCS